MQKIYDIQPRVSEVKIVEAVPREQKKARSNKRLLLFCGIIVLVVIGAYAIKYYSSHKNTEDTSQVLSEVGKLVSFPQREVPTVATVTDVKPLQSQEFFKDTEIGDKLLLFTRSKRAILYRPSTNKIIVVAPLNN